MKNCWLSDTKKCSLRSHFGRHVLDTFWLHFGPFWLHFGPFLGHFAAFGLYLGAFWATFLVFGAEIRKNTMKFTLGIKFLTNFRLQTVFPRPGGGTIAAGNRIAHFGDPGLIFCVFNGFWVESENQCFLMSLWVVQHKSQKTSLGGPRVAKVAPGRRQESAEGTL